ncbi:MAG: hypothetical protein QM651_07995 [Rhodoblastus sp.]
MSDRKMRAKVRVASIIPGPLGEDGKVSYETLQLHGVAKNEAYSEDGSDENNTFAKFSPSVSMAFHIANPALIGAFEIGETFYVDFIPAPK